MRRRRSSNALKLRLSSLFHWATHLVFVTQLTWRSIAYPPLLRMLFLFGWPPCQRSDMTLVEVSQHAYDNSYIRSILSFVFFFKETHVNLIWYLYPFSFNKLCLSLSLSLSHVRTCTYMCVVSHDAWMEMWLRFYVCILSTDVLLYVYTCLCTKSSFTQNTFETKSM